MQCYNCFKFGRMAKSCRNEKRCPMCGDKDHNKDSCTDVTPRCANCKGTHRSIDSQCRIYEKNKLLCERMAYENLSYAEAHSLIFGVTRAPRRNKEEFPNIEENTVRLIEPSKRNKEVIEIKNAKTTTHNQMNNNKENLTSRINETRMKAAEFFDKDGSQFYEQHKDNTKEDLNNIQL